MIFVIYFFNKIFSETIEAPLKPELLLLIVSHCSYVSLWGVSFIFILHVIYQFYECMRHLLPFFMSLFLDMLLLKSRISDIHEAET